jgi:hypothetical protein
MTLPPADLQKLRQQLTEDVQSITQNYGNLKVRKMTAQRNTSEHGNPVHALMHGI